MAILTAGRGIAVNGATVSLDAELGVPLLDAAGDGVTDDTAAFVAAAATGRKYQLEPNRVYLISSGITMTSGAGFVCPAGFAEIKLKTGSGGFNITNTGGTRTATDRCVFSCVSVDDIDLQGLRMYPDGAAERVIYPIRTSGGFATKGLRIRDVEFTGFSAMSGGLIGINTAGAGAYYVENITARSCGTALTTWTGGLQITVVEIDNDMVASVPSAPGVLRNIRAIDVLLSGAALSTYGQQTDVVNIAGISGTDRKGPYIDGIYADGVGEVLDVFGGFCVAKGIRARRAYNSVVKLVHAARHCDMEIEAVESFGLAVVTLAGSSAVVGHTSHNSVRIGTVTGGGTYGLATSDSCVVLLQDNGGGPATCLPKFNHVTIGNVLGDGVNLRYVVNDSSNVDNDNRNLIEVGRASGWATRFCFSPADNATIRVADGTDVRLRLPAGQALTTATPTIVDFSQVDRDRNSEALTASDAVRCAFPGRKSARAQVRISGLNADDNVELELLKAGSPVRATAHEATSGGLEHTFEVEGIVYIAESEAGSSAADLSVRITVVSGGSPSITANTTLSFFEVVDLT